MSKFYHLFFPYDHSLKWYTVFSPILIYSPNRWELRGIKDQCVNFIDRFVGDIFFFS